MEVEVKLPNPHYAQKQILDSKARFITVMAGRRFGKSLISQTECIEQAIYGKRVAYITPTYGLAKVFFDDLALLIPDNIAVSNKSDLTFKFITGGIIRFFTGERLDNLRGLKFHLVIIDEASFINDLENGWNNSIRPTLTDFKGKAIFISTPRGKNFFYSMYLRGKEGNPNYESFKFTTYDNPHIDPTEIDEARNQLPKPVFEQEYLANPSENAANPFGIDGIKSCIAPLSANPIQCLGIDLAKYNDWTVITGIDSMGNVCYFERFQSDWGNTINKIKNLPRVPTIVDATGVGDPIAEELQRAGLDVEAFKFTSQSKQELMLGLQSAIHQKKIHYPDGVIVDELCLIEYQYSATGVKYSAPQGFHDDCVMSLALAWRKYDYKAPTGFYSFA